MANMSSSYVFFLYFVLVHMSPTYYYFGRQNKENSKKIIRDGYAWGKMNTRKNLVL